MIIPVPGEASSEAVDELEQNEIVKNADMIFCLGGGKAIDTGKLLAHRMNKPYFTFPTIASTCACNSALGIYYYPNHEFRTFFRVDRPPVHIFISTKVIAEAPAAFLWAGIGDGMSKETEVRFSARGRDHELTLEEQAGSCTGSMLHRASAAIWQYRQGGLPETILCIQATRGCS